MLFPPASRLNPPPLEWLWPGYLGVGSLAILDGDPGLGKSFVTLDLAARLSSGRPWPDNAAAASPAASLLLCAEDPETVLVSRLRALDADLDRVFLWPRPGAGGSSPGSETATVDLDLPRLPAEIDRLDQALRETGARLVVIDPIVAFLDRSTPMNNDASVRRALSPLARLAQTHRAAILLVRHLNKDPGSQALYRGGGSIGFIAACRLAWLAAPDPRENRVILAQSKNNHAPLAPSLAYRLPTKGSALAWLGPVPWTADELAARRPRPSRRRARDFLRAFLEPAPRPCQEIWTAARQLGIPESTLRRAKTDLAIRIHHVGNHENRSAYWLLPGQSMPAEPSETPNLDSWLERWKTQYEPADNFEDVA